MSNSQPRRPVRFQEDNTELLKSMGSNYSEAKDKTDYVNDQHIASQTASIHPTYRTPPDRVNGNKMFRRYLNGVLDMEYATHKVIDAVRKYKQNVAPLDGEDLIALQVIFPGCFDGSMDPMMATAMGAVHLDLLPEEIAMIRFRVAQHIAEVLNYNGGQGGGTVPGRSVTTS